MSIREKRVSIQMTQKELADKMFIGRSAVANWETGRTNPRAELLPKIAKVLNCTVDELLRVDEPEETDKTKSQTSGNLEIENDSNKIKA